MTHVVKVPYSQRDIDAAVAMMQHSDYLEADRYTFVSSKRKRDKHGVLGAARYIGEKLMVEAARQHGAEMVDIGGNARRYYDHSPDLAQYMRFWVPVRMDGDVWRRRDALRLAPGRVDKHALDWKTVDKLRGKVVLMTHVSYYIEPRLMAKVCEVAKAVYCLHHPYHNLPAQGTFEFALGATEHAPAAVRAEMEWQTISGSHHGERIKLIKAHAKGDTHDYEHPLLTGVHAPGCVDTGLVSWRNELGEVIRLTRLDRMDDPPPQQFSAAEESIIAAMTRVSIDDAESAGRHQWQVAIRKGEMASTPGRLKFLVEESARRRRESHVAHVNANEGLLTRASTIAADDLSCTRSVVEAATRKNTTFNRLASAWVYLAARIVASRFAKNVLRTLLMLMPARRRNRKRRLDTTNWPRGGASKFPRRVGACKVCTTHARAHPDVKKRGECEVRRQRAFEPAGIGLPISALVYHDCPVTGHRAIVERVLDPFEPVGPPPGAWKAVIGAVAACVPSINELSEWEWAGRYAKGKRERKLAASLKRVQWERKGMVKRELTPGEVEEDDDGVVRGKKKPRWITSQDETKAAFDGPWATALSKAMAREFDLTQDCETYLRVGYAIGYNADQLGVLRTRIEDFVGPDGFEFEYDFSSFDARIQRWQNALVLYAIHGEEALPVSFLRAMKKDLGSTHVLTAFVEAYWEERRRSGDNVTSVFNTVIHRAFWIYVARICRQGRWEFRTAVVVGGDDSYGKACGIEREEFDAIVEQAAKDFGWDIGPNPGHTRGFYSGYWVPLQGEREVKMLAGEPATSRYWLCPKPGRAWAKASYHLGPASNHVIERWRHGAAVGNRGAWRSAPILRVLQRQWEHSAGRPITDTTVSHWHDLEERELNWAFWEAHYEMSRERIEEFELLVEAYARCNIVIPTNAHEIVGRLVEESGFPLDENYVESQEWGLVHRPNNSYDETPVI